MLKSDLKRIDNLTDDDIDYSDIPPLTDEQLAAMKPLREMLSEVVSDRSHVTIQLDADVVHWFKEQEQEAGGSSYQALINAALREHIEHRQEPLENTLRRIIREELQLYVTGSVKEP